MNDMPTGPWTNPAESIEVIERKAAERRVMSRVDGGQSNGVVEGEAAEEGMR